MYQFGAKRKMIYEGYATMIKICNDMAKFLKQTSSDQGKSFCISEKLFLMVRDYVYSNKAKDGTRFPVKSADGKQMFWVQYTENLVLGSKRNDFLDYEKRFLKNENLDFSLLDQYRKFVFTEVEEYSLAIAELLQKYRPEKRIVFLDKRAKYFIKGKSVRFFPFCGVAGRYMELLKKWTQGKNQGLGFFNRTTCLLLFRRIKRLERKNEVCIVATDKNYFWPTDVVRNSVKLMYSLLWCTSKKTLGNQNADKTIVLLDYPCYNEGLISIVKWTYAHIRWLLEKGYTPVMDLHTRPNQYLNAEDDNMWEYFFEPVSEVTCKEAYESKNVISAVDNGIILGEGKINSYQEKWINRSVNTEEFNKLIRVNAETEAYMEAEIPLEIRQEKRVMGVVMRGTGFRKEVAEKWNKEWRKDVVDARIFLQACNYYKDELKCEYIFLATEDAEYFAMAQDFFGDKLLFIDQKRAVYDYANQEYIPLNQVLGMKDGRIAGRNYLAIIKSLAECSALFFNINCGAVDMARYWNEGRYESFRRIESNWEPKA